MSNSNGLLSLLKLSMPSQESKADAMTVVCAQCGHKNPSHVRVCANCAALLANLCPACGFENPAGFKFCGNCGANLLIATPHSRADSLSPFPNAIPSNLVEKIVSAGKQLEGERRNVTILFTDVVGFTSLSEKLDPEQVYTIIEQVQKAFLCEIYTYEGWFDKFLGDGLMAIFGAPVAHEDDAARAVRAALGMQIALKRINEELDAHLGVTLRIRMGLNSGTVVVATMGSDMKMNYTPLGDAVNVAARLQTIAEPGNIVVSSAVYEQVKSLFDFAELGSIRVKGRIEPVEIYQVLGTKRTPTRPRGIPGLSAPLIGRAQEFAQLQQLMANWRRGHDSQLALITGEAGIGKSRLTAEFKQQLPPNELRVVESACLAYGQSAYDLFVRLLKALFHITADDDEIHARARVREHIARVLKDQSSRDQVLPYLEHLLSIPIAERELADRIRYLEPAQLRQQIFLAVRDLLVAESQAQPLLLILEDLHWIDQASLDLLVFLINAIEDSRILFYCTSRPETQSSAGAKLDKLGATALRERYLRLDLQRLSDSDSARLVERLLSTFHLPSELKQVISARAEGNPFYLEEIIRMLIDRGIVRCTAQGWETTPGTDLSNLEVPRTLQGLIMARVDHLEERPRETLQYAAVIGRTFSRRLLDHVMADDNLTLESDLQLLCDHELIACVPSTAEAEYTFRNVLIQETVYASLLHRRRERLHHQVAESIEQLYPDRLDDYTEQLAFHYQESRDHARALPHLIRAAERAARRYANDEAMRYYYAAQGLMSSVPVTPEQRTAVYQGLGDVQQIVGSYDSALQSFRNALEITRSLPDAPARAIADLARKIGRVFERKGSYDEALRWLDTALDELDRDPDSLRAVERMRVYHEMGWVHYRRGDLDKAYQWRMRSLEIGAGTDYYAELGSAYNGLVPLFAAKGDWDRAHAYAMEGLRMRERIGDSEGTARCYLNLANIAASQGEWGKAIEYNNRGLALATRVGQASTIFSILNNLGHIYTSRGDGTFAREYLTRALAIAERSGDAHQICMTLNNLAEVALLEGQCDEALATLEQASARAASTRNITDLTQMHWLFARVHLARGDMQQAESSARRALSTAEAAGLKSYEGRACRALGCVLREEGKLDDARGWFQRAADIFVKLKDRLELARTQLELAQLYSVQRELAALQHEAQQAAATFASLGAEADQRRAHELLQAVMA